MSIASEIQRISLAKDNLRVAIGNKGVIIPANKKIDEYFEYVNDIELGLTIQNGTIVNYKATSETIPAGTFIEIDRVPTYLTLPKITYNNVEYDIERIHDVKKLRNDVLLIACSIPTTAYISGVILAYSLNNNGINEFLGYDMFDVFSQYNSITITPLDDNHFIAFGSRERSTNDNVRFYVYTYTNAFSKSATNQVSNTTNVYRPVLSQARVVEDSSYYNIHCLCNGAQGSNNVMIAGFKVSKSDYSVSNQTYLGLGSLKNTNNDLFILNNDIICVGGGKYQVLSYNGTYTSVVSATTLVNDSSNLLRLLNYDSNKFVAVYNETNTNNIIKGSLLEFSNQTFSTLSYDTLISETSAFYASDDFAIEPYDTTKCFILYHTSVSGSSATDLKARVIDIANLTLYSESNIETGTIGIENINGITNFSIIHNSKIVMAYNNKVGNFIINNNSVTSDSGADTIRTATTKIEGLTNTVCTTTTAGEVYLLAS